MDYWTIVCCTDKHTHTHTHTHTHPHTPTHTHHILFLCSKIPEGASCMALDLWKLLKGDQCLQLHQTTILNYSHLQYRDSCTENESGLELGLFCTIH